MPASTDETTTTPQPNNSENNSNNNTDLKRLNNSQSRISHYTDAGYQAETYTVRYRNKMYKNISNNSTEAKTEENKNNDLNENIITPRNPRNASRERTRSFKNLDDQLVTISAAPSQLTNNNSNNTPFSRQNSSNVISNQPTTTNHPPARPPPPRPPQPKPSFSESFHSNISDQLILSHENPRPVLQATVEFSFELRELYNIDLFEKGHYHVRISVLESNHLSNNTPPLSLQEHHDNLNVADYDDISHQSTNSANNNKNSSNLSSNNTQNNNHNNINQQQSSSSSSNSIFFTKSSSSDTNYSSHQNNSNQQNQQNISNINTLNINPLNRFQSEVISVRPPLSKVLQPKKHKKHSFNNKQLQNKNLKTNHLSNTSKNYNNNNVPSKNSHKYESSTESSKNNESSSNVRCPTAVSDVCQINYKRESVPLEQIYLFRVHKLINCMDIDEELSNWDVPFLFELWWEEDEIGGRSENKVQGPQRVSQRIVNVSWNSKTGTHDYGVCVFEYGYAAGLEFVVHGSLTALHQPYKTIVNDLSSDGFIKVPTLEDILFTGLAGRAGEWESINDMDKNQLISTANSSQAKIINHLNVAYEVLAKYLSKKPDKLAMNFKEKIDSVSMCLEVPEAIAQINMNLAQVCSMLLERWTIVQDELAMSQKYYLELKNKYHANKITRYQQGHFLLKSSFDKAVKSYEDNMMLDREAVFAKMAGFLRESKYFKQVRL